MSCKVIVTLLLTVLVTLCAGADWCNIQSCKAKGKHTLCAYPQSSPAKKCVTPSDLKGGIQDFEKRTILSVHNGDRKSFSYDGDREGSPGPQPKAKTDIPPLTWDNELEQIAQRWVNQCIPGNDKCRDVSDAQVGQNSAVKSIKAPADPSQRFFFPDIVQEWYDQVQYFDAKQAANFSGKLTGANGKYIGSYTQIMWAKTTKIGCAARSFRDGNMNKRIFVCNYKPAGNIAGQPVYDAVVYKEGCSFDDPYWC